MHTEAFHINKHLAGNYPVDSVLSFNPFVNHLERHLQTADAIKGKFYSFALEHFKSDANTGQTANETSHDPYALELIYSALSPVLQSEDDCFWALSTPVPNEILFCTDAFFNLITSRDIKEAASSIITDDKEFKRQQLEYVYRLILKRLYHFATVLSSNVYYTYTNPATGLLRYYHIHINTNFIDIEVKGQLPDLDFETIENYLQNEDGGIDVLAEILPLSLFKFEGFSVITLEDVTSRRAIEDIRDAISNAETDQKELYKQVINSLKILTENKEVRFGLLPFLKLNGEPLFDESSCSESVLMQSAKRYGVAEEAYIALVTRYEKEPKARFFSSITEAHQEKYFILKVLRESGIKSYAVIPVFHNKHIAGIMEVYSEKELVFYENLLSRLEFALPLIAQLLQNTIDRFTDCINDVIKERYTSIQSAVQWKFNEVAWEQIKNPQKRRKKGYHNDITFKDVYPLYGAIDIRNSTIERNLALQQDMRRVTKLLLKIFLTLDEQYPNERWQPLIDKTNSWLHKLQNPINTSEEVLINEFLEDEAGKVLEEFKGLNPESGEVMDTYLEMISQDNDGPAFTQRNRLENAMQSINHCINSYFERAQHELQKIYPNYFEKFRTDGVEYDIYVGQSIFPKKAFSADCLKKLRLWQLTSMVDIARQTHKLLDHLPADLQTTQLIFIHSMAIDICFRNDERRFDVEGAYNIRYEVIKKRIDKVMLLDGSERLTQPGKIAIVYFTDEEAQEQLGYIKQIQKQKMLLPEVEDLKLEELQGVVGLRALRVSIDFGE
ncbi:hypothetical protein [Mucilaginibacter terrae]|uniref:GAF domain-containing protein n=1 Tax=Mucilaginibacter terrae TaxID=1955052 RepID=A0ABU3GY32_9SPHI|nr:hypothetical protein [Mucilaginibacter terrae]MDT3404686.1 hypothetical protein [Mucilaginibacter terrae]